MPHVRQDRNGILKGPETMDRSVTLRLVVIVRVVVAQIKVNSALVGEGVPLLPFFHDRVEFGFRFVQTSTQTSGSLSVALLVRHLEELLSQKSFPFLRYFPGISAAELSPGRSTVGSSLTFWIMRRSGRDSVRVHFPRIRRCLRLGAP